jgi:hypothetical protein
MVTKKCPACKVTKRPALKVYDPPTPPTAKADAVWLAVLVFAGAVAVTIVGGAIITWLVAG